jgi:cell division protein FtsB
MGMSESSPDKTPFIRNAILVLLLVSVALIVHNIFGQNGFLAARRQRKEVQMLQEQILHLKQENQQLGKENHALRSDPSAIEGPAHALGLAKPGQKIYILPDPAPTSSPPPTIKQTPSHP